MKKVLNITNDNNDKFQIKVIDYFKVDKTEYIVYEKEVEVKNKTIYLSRFENNNLVSVDAENVELLQSIMKVLLTKIKDAGELKRLHYKKLDKDKLNENIVEKAYQEIKLGNEQYDDLILEVKQVRNKKPLLIGLLILLIGVAITAYFVWFRGGDAVKDQFTVSFQTNSNFAVGAITIEPGKTVDLISIIPEKEGYSFAGWHIDEALTEKASGYFEPKKDVTLYAKWKDNVVSNGECGIGQVVTLKDGSKWRVVAESKETDSTITLLSENCGSERKVFDDSKECVENNQCINKYENSSIKKYLEGEYLTGLGELKTDITTIRLITKDEFESLAKIEDSSLWLYNSSICEYGSWWTMTPFESMQLYMINSTGLAEPNQEIASGIISQNGVANSLLGVKPVIVINKNAIQKSS